MEYDEEFDWQFCYSQIPNLYGKPIKTSLAFQRICQWAHTEVVNLDGRKPGDGRYYGFYLSRWRRCWEVLRNSAAIDIKLTSSYFQEFESARDSGRTQSFPMWVHRAALQEYTGVQLFVACAPPPFLRALRPTGDPYVFDLTVAGDKPGQHGFSTRWDVPVQPDIICPVEDTIRCETALADLGWDSAHPDGQRGVYRIAEMAGGELSVAIELMIICNSFHFTAKFENCMARVLAHIPRNRRQLDRIAWCCLLSDLKAREATYLSMWDSEAMQSMSKTGDSGIATQECEEEYRVAFEEIKARGIPKLTFVPGIDRFDRQRRTHAFKLQELLPWPL